MDSQVINRSLSSKRRSCMRNSEKVKISTSCNPEVLERMILLIWKTIGLYT
jgi:hypothetical protein